MDTAIVRREISSSTSVTTSLLWDKVSRSQRSSRPVMMRRFSLSSADLSIISL